jgi:hypothetical protein
MLDISIGPDNELELSSFKIDQNDLILNGWLTREQIGTKSTVNLLTGDFETLIYGGFDAKYDLYFYFYAKCPRCQSSFNSCDINLYHFDKRIEGPLDMDQETRYVSKGEITFSLDYDYPNNKLTIGFLGAKGKDLVLPIIDFDFSDLDKLFLRLKTFILFS